MTSVLQKKNAAGIDGNLSIRMAGRENDPGAFV
jgi:hypothetical protein